MEWSFWQQSRTFSSLTKDTTKCLQLQSVSKVEANLREQASGIDAKGFANLTAAV